MKALLISVLLLNSGGIKHGIYETGFEPKQMKSVEECLYLRNQNQFTLFNFGPEIGQVVQFCIPVEERSA